jgi:hypothetical protein
VLVGIDASGLQVKSSEDKGIPTVTLTQKINNKPYVDGDCGLAKADLEWQLTVKNGVAIGEVNGLIVQCIELDAAITPCKKDTEKATLRYCEAWVVEKGKILVKGIEENRDFNTTKDFPGTYGTFKATYYYTFIPYIKLKYPPWVKEGDPGHFPQGLDLPTLDPNKYPNEFDHDYVTEWGERAMATKWDCCCDPIKKTEITLDTFEDSSHDFAY